MNAYTLFDKEFESGKLDEMYMEYIMEHGDRHGLYICNGDKLIEAFERGVLLDEFRETFGLD